MDFKTESTDITERKKQLINAVKAGNIDEVRQKLKGLPSSLDIDNIYESSYYNYCKGKPLLFLACCSSDSKEILKLLFQRGGNLRINNFEGLNLFQYACMYGNIESVKCIIGACQDFSFLHEKSDDDKDALACVTESFRRRKRKIEDTRNFIQILQELGKFDINRYRRDGLTELLNAVIQKDVQLAEILCSVGADVNIGYHRSYKALQWVCEKGGAVEMIQLLLDHGANINETWRHCQRPIHIALKHGLSPQARVLLKAGANISGQIFLQNLKYQTISTFCLAARSCPDLIPDFLMRGANPNEYHPTTGLHVLGFALKKNANRKIIASLIRAGANTDNVGLGKSAIKSCKTLDQMLAFVDCGFTLEQIENELKENLLRRTLLDYSYGEEHVEDTILFLISNGAKLEGEASRENSNLILCLKKRLFQATESLIEHGVNVNHIGENGETALHIACQNIGDRDVLRILLKLLDAGSLVDSKNDQGLTPLLLTLKERKYRHSDEIFSKIVHCLIDHGADKHARFPGTQESTLCHAIDCRDLETAKCLIKAGYNVNTREEDGDLPIFRCVPFDFSMASDFFSLLLEAGTDPNALDGKGTPLLERLFQLLCNSEKSTRLFSYSKASEDVIRRNFTLLLHYKANPNTAKEGRDSLLFKAIEYEKEDLVEVLIEAGANISHFGNNKKTALDCCCHLKESEINAVNSSGLKMTDKGRRLVDILIDAGFPLDLANSEGQYPLDLVIQFINTDVQIKHMLSKGADPNMYDKREDSPLLRSVYRSPVITLALLQAGADVTVKSMDGRTFYDLFMERVFFDTSLSFLGEEFASEFTCITETSPDMVILKIRKIPPGPTLKRIKKFFKNLKVSCEESAFNNQELTVAFHDNLTGWTTLQMLNQFPLNYKVQMLRENGKLSVWMSIKEKLDHQRWIERVEDEASRLSQIEQSNSASDVIKSLISKGTNDFNSQTSNGVLPLCVAVRLGCLSLVQFMLEKEVNPNSMDGMEETPLYLSLKSGQMDTSKLLLDAKADVNYPGNTSEVNVSRTESLLSRVLDKRLFLSSMEQRILLTEILIKYGADVNICREGENSPLIKAVQFQSNELVDILLKKGSHVNHPGRDMATPLHLCCISKRDENDDSTRSSDERNSRIFKKLMESGASVNHQDCEGNTPVHVAIIKRRSYKTLEMIHGDFEVNAKNVKGVTCLMLAAEWEEWKKWDTEISQDVEALTQKGAEVNLTDEKGHTVVAEKERWLPEISKDVVDALMQKGADVNLKDKEGNSVLHYLVCKGPVESFLDIFLNSGANIKDCNNDGLSPLNKMVKDRRKLSKEDIQYIISNGADPNNCPSGCKSPLIYALLRGETIIAETLVAAGAQVNYMTESGQTALNVALRYLSRSRKTIFSKKCKQDTVVDWLLDIGADTNMLTPKMQSPICILMKSQFTRTTVSILSNLLRHNANPNLGLDNPLCSAAAISIEAVRLLLNAHVDVNKPDIDGNTALVNCLESSVEDKLDIVEDLIENKADVNSIGKSGRYPIESALEHRRLYETPVRVGFARTYRKYSDTEKLISALLNAGANLNLRKSGEDSPLHLAVCLNCPEIVRLLISNGADVNSIGVENQTPLHRYVDHICKENDLMRNEQVTSTYFHTLGRYEKSTEEVEDGIIDILIANKANPNTMDVNGKTPLILTLDSNIEYFRKLLEAGGDPLLKENNLYEKCAEIDDLRFLNALLEVKGSDHVCNTLFSKVWNKLRTPQINGESRKILGNVFSLMLTSSQTIDVNMKNQFGNIPLIFFCRENEVNVVEKLLQRGVSINSMDDHGFTAMHALFHSPQGSKDKIKILSLLLEKKADVNLKDKSGESLFQKSYDHYTNNIYRHNYYQWLGSFIKNLIIAGAEYEEGSLTTLLPLASERQQFDLMTILIQHGADLTVTRNGAGVMHMCWSNYTRRDLGIHWYMHVLPRLTTNADASKEDCLGCIEMFKQHGGLLTGVDREGNTPLLAFLTSSLFSKGVQVEIEDAIISALACDKITVKHKNPKNSKRSAIHIAASKGRLSSIKILVSKGADLCDVDECNNNCFHVHLSSDSLKVSTEILEYLVSNGVSVNQINTSGQTPLFLLVTRKEESPQQNNAIEYLLKNGADPNLHSYNCNALAHAIQMKKEKTTFLLLKNGAKVNEIGKEATALHVLFKNHETYCRPHDGTFEKLLCGILSKGVCVNAKDYEGNTVLHLAVNVIDKLHDAENLILKLLKNGCNINAVDNAEMTPLGRICQKGHRTSPKAANFGICFLSNGADPNIDSALYWSLQKMTYNQQTIHSSWKTMIMQIIERTACCNMHKKDVPCIVLAIKLGDVDIVKALIERGANIHETDRYKSSCLLIACDLEVKERNEITGLLLHHGSSINNTNTFGMSPLSNIVEKITNSKEAIKITSESTKMYVETDLSLFNQLVCGGADLTSSSYRESPLVILTKEGYFGAASTLVKCGYDFKKDRQFQNLNLEIQHLSTMEIEGISYQRIGYEKEKKEFLELLKECQMNNILTLSSLCRNMLRKHLTTVGKGAEVESKINKLLLPTKIKEFLAFRDTIQNMERMEVVAIERNLRTSYYHVLNVLNDDRLYQSTYPRFHVYDDLDYYSEMYNDSDDY
uniref:Uncharacterized protein LOC111100329 isoform X3 n=1 Tax=Crassostrea virginica TaxID=6565 RepID=A0A8B8ACY5_CRAVI|nr:uncharacterized protein LOC111100329 isoform X3 [Crassostrea virginica]